MFGWDHGISADFEELSAISRESKRVHKALGTGKIFREEDSARLKAFRRSIVSARNIRKGEVFREEMLDFKRPGDGIEPGCISKIIGKREKRDIKCDELIKILDF